jgi:hypothetical protein
MFAYLNKKILAFIIKKRTKFCVIMFDSKVFIVLCLIIDGIATF